MKRIFIVFLLFSTSIFIFSFTVLGQTLYHQKIIFSNQVLSQPLTGTFTNNSDFSNETTTLLFELKHDIDPHLIWSRFETKYGDITNENVDAAIEYYRYEIQNYFHEIKTRFQKNTNHKFSRSELIEASPYFTMSLDHTVGNLDDLSDYVISLVSRREIHQLIVIPTSGKPPISELDPGGGGSSSCEYKFTDAKTAVDYQYPYNQNGTILTGHGVNVGIYETYHSGFFVNSDYNYTYGPNNTQKYVFDNNIYHHPHHDYLLNQDDSSPYLIYSSHANRVAHVLAGYNGIASNGTIYSAPFHGSLQHNFNTLDDPLSVSSYYLNTDSKVNDINASFGYESYNSSHEYQFNQFVYQHQIPIIASSGNFPNIPVLYPSAYHNVFSIGGTNTDGSDYYNIGVNGTQYINNNNGVDKPNIIAPAVFNLYNLCEPLEENGHGTSFAAPMVTGAVALLFEKRPYLKIKPQEVYALLMATSSNLNFTATDDNTFNGYIGNKSGAGILQIKNLLDHSENTTSMILSQSDSYKEEFVNINPFTGSNKTISVAAFWLAKTENNQTNLNHYRLKIYHNDDLIGVSESIINNFQLVLGNISSGGTLRIKLERIGGFNGVHNDHIGIAWALTDDGGE